MAGRYHCAPMRKLGMELGSWGTWQRDGWRCVGDAQSWAAVWECDVGGQRGARRGFKNSALVEAGWDRFGSQQEQRTPFWVSSGSCLMHRKGGKNRALVGVQGDSSLCQIFVQKPPTHAPKLGSLCSPPLAAGRAAGCSRGGPARGELGGCQPRLGARCGQSPVLTSPLLG